MLWLRNKMEQLVRNYDRNVFDRQIEALEACFTYIKDFIIGSPVGKDINYKHANPENNRLELIIEERKQTLDSLRGLIVSLKRYKEEQYPNYD